MLGKERKIVYVESEAEQPSSWISRRLDILEHREIQRTRFLYLKVARVLQKG